MALGSRDVVDPSAPAVPGPERRADDLRSLRGDQQQARIAARHSSDAQVVIANGPEAARGPKLPQLLAVDTTELPDHDRGLCRTLGWRLRRLCRLCGQVVRRGAFLGR